MSFPLLVCRLCPMVPTSGSVFSDSYLRLVRGPLNSCLIFFFFNRASISSNPLPVHNRKTDLHYFMSSSCSCLLPEWVWFQATERSLGAIYPQCSGLAGEWVTESFVSLQGSPFHLCILKTLCPVIYLLGPSSSSSIQSQPHSLYFLCCPHTS